jgi:hypothetical protein
MGYTARLLSPGAFLLPGFLKATSGLMQNWTSACCVIGRIRGVII